MSSSPVEARVSPLAALAVAVLAVSTSAILVRWSGAPSLVKAFYRVLFTGVILAPWALFRYRDHFARIRGRDLLVAAVSGTALALHFASWFESLNWTSVAASVTLVQAQPAFVAVGAWALLDERVDRRVVAGIGVALLGMVVMSLPEAGGESVTAPNPLLGNALAVVGAVTAAGYVLAGRSLRQRIALIPYVTVVYGVCVLVLGGLTLVRHGTVAFVAYPATGDPYPVGEWLLFLGMAVGPGIFGHTVINWALAHVESSVVSVSLLGEPVGSTLLALVLLSEVPTLVTLAGGVVVLTGIYVTTTVRESETAPAGETDPDAT
ncbi:DMT family transporter [Salinirubrum litoreum]|uniref:DMT family transporter n=1 Tax=Salinirubrum litoreum TaxID=1126234 RepID=A0ABD5R9R6_9EURY